MSNTFYVIPKNSDLQHYGVLGMKWGVRRYQNVDGSLTPAGQKRYKSEETKTKRALRVLKSGAIGSMFGPVGTAIGIAKGYYDTSENINKRNLENDMVSIQRARIKDTDSNTKGKFQYFSKVNEQSKTAADLYKAVNQNATPEEINNALLKSFREAERINDTHKLLKTAAVIGGSILAAAGLKKSINDFKEDGDYNKLIVNLMPGVKEVNGVEYINQQAGNGFKNIKNVLDSKINEVKQKTGEDVYKSVEENIKNMSEIDMEIELRNWKKVDGDN